MSYQQISCPQQNHHLMPVQYVCLESHCLKNSKFLSCIYCCQEIHKPHIQEIKSLKALLNEIEQESNETQFNGTKILREGVNRCKSIDDLKHNIEELVYFHNGRPKAQKLISRQNIIQKKNVKQFYENRNDSDQDQYQSTIKKPRNNKKSALCSNTPFISPILTFQQQDSQLSQYEFISPFCIANPEEKMVTAFAYPPINRFDQSVQINIKVERLTPFWLGIGVSKGKKIYEDGSKNHILMTSNGWTSVEGKFLRSKIKYCSKDTVKIKWDKLKSFLEFSCSGERETVNLGLQWDLDIYLCIVLFYKGDSVQLLS